LAWNEETNETGYYVVTDTFSHGDPVLTELIINGEWIETTPEHPFYTEEEGWLPADELESGMRVRNAEGEYELIWLKWNIESSQEMYNLTVDTAHTFFVGDGQWLVHNDCRKINMDAIDWGDYPDDLSPIPEGNLSFLDGDDYLFARDLADAHNDFLHANFPEKYKGFDIHEIQPIKFGGDPVSISNKMPITRPNHSIVTNWWNRLQRKIENNPRHYLE
jgi:hypothetical protein